MRHCLSKKSAIFQDSQELTVQIPALRRPTLTELQTKERWIESVKRDDSPEGPVTLYLQLLGRRDSIDSIHGFEYERYLMSKQNFSLGYQHREWLLQQQHELPSLAHCLWSFYIDFPGIVVVHKTVGGRIPYCRALGSRWEGYWHAFPEEFLSFGRIALGHA